MSKQVVVTLSTCALATSFLVCAASAQTVSEVQLIPLGTGSFGAAAASLTSTPVSQASGLTAPYHTKRDVPFQFAPPVTPSAVLLIPNPKPQTVVGPDSTFFGFAGLSVLDDANCAVCTEM